jgi:hypothetical protein
LKQLRDYQSMCKEPQSPIDSLIINVVDSLQSVVTEGVNIADLVMGD